MDTSRAERQAATQPDIRRAPSPFFHMQCTGTEELRYRLDNGADPHPFPLLGHLRSLGFTDYLAFFQPFGSSADPGLWPDMPVGVAMHEGITGSFSTLRRNGFSARVGRLRMLVPPLAVAVKAAATLEMAETLLGTYLGTASGRSVLRGHVQRGQGHVVHAVVWYSDMRGSTALAASASLETYLATLNAYYDCVVEAVDAQGGEILKFTGDGVLAMFPFEAGTQAGTDACWLALAAARDTLDRLGKVNARRPEAGANEIRCGIALHAGDVMYGNVGSARRLDFTQRPALPSMRSAAWRRSAKLSPCRSSSLRSPHRSMEDTFSRSVGMSCRVSAVRLRPFGCQRSWGCPEPEEVCQALRSGLQWHDRRGILFAAARPLQSGSARLIPFR
jgi:adenylate cyclase